MSGTKRARPYESNNGSYKKRNVSARDEDTTVYYTGSTGAPRHNYSSVPAVRGATVTGEMKYFDSTKNAPIFKMVDTWDGTLADPTTKNCLFCPTVGAAVNQRIGKATKVLKIKVKGFVNVPPVASATVTNLQNVMVRILLVWDKRCNATQFAGSLLLDGSTASDFQSLMGFQNTSNFGRFVVLKDKIMNLSNINLMDNPDTAGAGFQVGITRPFKFNHNFKTPVEFRFNATGVETISGLVDNSFHIVAACTGLGVTPSIIYNSRVCYKD